MSFGSEFRLSCLLKPVLQHHPLWENTKRILSEVAVFPLDPINKSDRDMDNAFMIDHGYQKSAENFEDEFLSMIETEVHWGFNIWLPLKSWHEIPNCTIAPLGMVEQGSIDDTGCIMKKRCIAHGQSLPGTSGLSIKKHFGTYTMP
jgi:hypothetical protein